MFLFVAQQWSPMTWTFMFIGMLLAILSVFVTFVIVLVRASRATDPARPRPMLIEHPGGGDASDAHHHPHAA